MTLPGLTKAQMIMIDRMMMENLEVPVELMMEHAGSSLARLAVKQAPKNDADFTIIVGSGNNGAGGMVAARRLASWGHNVEVYAPRGIVSFRRVPAGQFSRLRALDIPVSNDIPSESKSSDVVIDAYLGYGFVSREDRITARVFDFFSKQDNLICLDVPSGLDPDNGESEVESNPKATLTIAFVKKGLLKAYPNRTGDLFVCDVGVPMETIRNSLGIMWTAPYSQESLSHLTDAFQINSMVETEIVVSNAKLGWIPKNVRNQ